jgi:hypothetical protein
MIARSIRQPNAWAVLFGSKRIENLDWLRTPALVTRAKGVRGAAILLHAAQGCTRAEYERAVAFMADRRLARPAWCEDELGLDRHPVIPALRALPRGALVGRARVADVVQTLAGGCRISFSAGALSPCLLCGETRLHGDLCCPKPDPWAIPMTVGLVLADVEALPDPFYCNGRTPFFEVPEHMLQPRGHHGCVT